MGVKQDWKDQDWSCRPVAEALLSRPPTTALGVLSALSDVVALSWAAPPGWEEVEEECVLPWVWQPVRVSVVR